MNITCAYLSDSGTQEHHNADVLTAGEIITQFLLHRAAWVYGRDAALQEYMMSNKRGLRY
jgi:hypothetical protein